MYEGTRTSDATQEMALSKAQHLQGNGKGGGHQRGQEWRGFEFKVNLPSSATYPFVLSTTDSFLYLDHFKLILVLIFL